MNQEESQNRNYYTLLKEPSGKLYGDILNYGLEICSTALLVVNGKLKSQGELALRSLESLLVSSEESFEWPGTNIQGGVATVLRYNYNPQCVNVLRELTDSLYQWQRPELPQDLCLLRADSNSWLVSIAHEKDAYFYLTEVEVSDLINSLPELQSILSKDDPI